MSYLESSVEDVASLSELPARTMFLLVFMMSIGAALFIFVFHLFAWALGWPGPFLWFGGPSRLLDIATATLGVFVSVLFFAGMGIPIIKGLARFRFFNVRLKVR